MKEESIKQHGDQLGSVVSDTLKKNLGLELKNLVEPKHSVEIILSRMIQLRSLWTCPCYLYPATGIAIRPFSHPSIRPPRLRLRMLGQL